MPNFGQRPCRSGITLCCVALAMLCTRYCENVCQGAEADSGWKISAPPTLARQVDQQFPKDRSSVRQLLNAKGPLIRIESKHVATQIREVPSSKTSFSKPPFSKPPFSKPLSSLRVAERPLWQPSRPARKGSNISPSWEANNLSDFDLGETNLSRVVEPEETPAPGANTTAVEPADKVPSTSSHSQPKSATGTGDRDAHKSPSANELPTNLDESSGPTPSPSNELGVKEGAAGPSKSAPVRESPESTTPKKTNSVPTSSTQSQAAPSQATQPQTTQPPKLVAKPLTPLSRNQLRLRGRMQRVLKSYYRRPLNSRDHDPWEIMHGMLAYGVYSRVLQASPQGEPITAVGWLCYNKPSKRKTLLYINKQGELRARWGVGVQGHYGQFLAMLAQCRVDQSYPIRVGTEEFTVEDLIAAEQKTCQPGEELSFKLIALMHYCPSDTKWMNEQGSEWSIPRLIREELKQPIRGAPCGGTHRLSGLSLAVRTRIKRGEPIDGEYRRAQEFVERYERYALQFQNSDGSLSTEWFRGRGDDSDINRRIKTTGHILEWLLYSQSDDEIQSGRTFNTVNYLTNLMANNYSHDWEIGPLSHAIHALVLYDERIFQPHGEPEATKPSRPVASKQRQPQRQQRQRRQKVSSTSKRRR